MPEVSDYGVNTALYSSQGAKAGRTLSFGTFGMDTPANMQAWRAVGGNSVSIEAYWDRLQGAPGAALNTIEVSKLNTQIDTAHKLGMQVYLSVAVQYPPQWARNIIPKYKNQNGLSWTGGGGEDVRDWVWSAAGRRHIKDFVTKALQSADLSKVTAVRLGGGYYNELQFPRNRGVYPNFNSINYWGFGRAAQTGIGLAADQLRCPLPGYKPFTGTAAQDAQWTNWYLNSLQTFMVDLITMHRSAGWQGPIYVLHPGYGLRSNWTSSNFNYRIEMAEGHDSGRMMDAYKGMANVWPGTTWVDQPDQPGDLSLDSNLAPWRKIKKEADLRGKSANMYGENTGGGNDDNMNRVFSGPLANGYNVLMWLNYPMLERGISGTLPNMQRNIDLITGRST